MLNHRFIEASINGDINAVKQLLDKYENNCNLGLTYAAHGGHVDIINFLIGKGAKKL